MINEIRYLTDEELTALISAAESEELASAPPGILDSILEELSLDQTDRPKRASRPPAYTAEVRKHTVSIAQKRSEFRKYCIRVISASAAAIVLMFAVPAYTGISGHSIPDMETFLSAPADESGTAIFEHSGSSIMDAVNDFHCIYDKERNSIFE